MDGLALMERVRAGFPETAIILMTGAATVESAVAALKGGASDYVLKPFGLSEIFHVVQRCLERAAAAAREPRAVRGQSPTAGARPAQVQSPVRRQPRVPDAAHHHARLAESLARGAVRTALPRAAGEPGRGPQERHAARVPHREPSGLRRVRARRRGAGRGSREPGESPARCGGGAGPRLSRARHRALCECGRWPADGLGRRGTVFGWCSSI